MVGSDVALDPASRNFDAEEKTSSLKLQVPPSFLNAGIGQDVDGVNRIAEKGVNIFPNSLSRRPLLAKLAEVNTWTCSR